MAVKKRFTAPKFWPIEVKAKKYVVSPMPGPHSKDRCIPLALILRNILGHASTMKEAKEILNNRVVKINGIVRKERGFPVGLMDVVEVDKEFYRVMPSKEGLKLIKTEEADLRLTRIINKIHLGKNKVQLCLHDGTNIVVEKDDFKTCDVLGLDIAHGTIKHTVKFDRGSLALVTDGHNRGLYGKIHAIDRKLKTVSITSDKSTVLVPIKYVFVVGHEKPLIALGE